MKYYSEQPAAVEISEMSDGDTQVILRRNVLNTSDGWTCDEMQINYQGQITMEQIEDVFDLLWGDESDPKTIKIKEMSAACNAAIVNGVDVKLSDGNTYHFSLSHDDQLRLLYLQNHTEGENLIPYHADGGSCQWYSIEDFTAIANAVVNWILYHESYFNSLQIYIKSLAEVEDIQNVYYGMIIPDEYQTSVFQHLLMEQKDKETVTENVVKE